MTDRLNASIGGAEKEILTRMNKLHTDSQTGANNSRARHTANDNLKSGKNSASLAAMGAEPDAMTTQVATTHPGVMAAQTLTMERLQKLFPRFDNKEGEAAFFFPHGRQLYGTQIGDKEAYLLYQKDKQHIQEWKGGASFVQVFDKLSPELQDSIHFKFDAETAGIIINPEERIENMSMFKAVTEAKFYTEELDSPRSDLTTAHKTLIEKKAVSPITRLTTIILPQRRESWIGSITQTEQTQLQEP